MRMRGWMNVLVAAGATLLATGALAQQTLQPPAPPTAPTMVTAPIKSSPSFFNTMLAPRLDARLRGETAAALDYTSRFANPWTRDEGAVDRVEIQAIRATKSAVKRYFIERLGLDGWSIPVAGGRGQGVAAYRTDSGGTRLRFRFAHMAPGAELLIPAGNRGKVALGFNARGYVGASFETWNSNLRVAGSYDPSSRDLSIALVSRF